MAETITTPTITTTNYLLPPLLSWLLYFLSSVTPMVTIMTAIITTPTTTTKNCSPRDCYHDDLYFVGIARFVDISAHICARVLCVWVYVWVCVCVSVCVCVCVCMCVCGYTHLCISYICACMCMYVCVGVLGSRDGPLSWRLWKQQGSLIRPSSHTHTNTHTQTQTHTHTHKHTPHTRTHTHTHHPNL